jgi:hypothetical protein
VCYPAAIGVIDGLETIEAHPAMRMTLDQFDQAMTRTSHKMLTEVAQKYDRVRQNAQHEHHQLAGMIGTLNVQREQRFLA